MKKPDYKRFRVDVSPIHEVFSDNPIIDKMLFRWWNEMGVDFFYHYENIQLFREFLADNHVYYRGFPSIKKPISNLEEEND